MTSFRAAAGSGEDWPSACDDCLAALGDLPLGTNLGIVYASGSLAHALDLIAARLKEATGVEIWVGTGGTSVCTSEREGLNDAAISVLAAALPPDGFQVFDGLADQAEAATPSCPKGPDAPALAIVHGDPRQTKTPTMIGHLSESTGAFLVGGLTSAVGNGAMQVAGRPTEGGLSGVLMSADIPVITGLTQGCTPIGPERRITGIEGPWIRTLDGAPALEGLKTDVGPVLARNLERMTGFIYAARPECGADRNGYLVRDLGDIDPINGTVMVGDDDLRPGDRLCFVKRDPDGARIDLERLAADLKSRARGRPVLGGLYHSCVGRGRYLFGTDEAELAIIEGELGPIPLAGLHTNGEIFRDRLYGYSAVLTLFLDEEAP